MIRYRIIPKDTVCDVMLDTEARALMMQLKDTNPDNSYEIEKYNFIPPEGKGIARDQDLH